ncbi:MAG: hypothetical protein ACI9DF_004803, partial [Verrucomicrobiales bacterium]
NSNELRPPELSNSDPMSGDLSPECELKLTNAAPAAKRTPRAPPKSL